MDHTNVIERAAIGVAAGLAGTLALQQVRTGTQQLLPETTPPFRAEPGKFMVEHAEEVLPEETREQIPETVESATAASLALGYGATAGAIYGALRGDNSNLLVDGALLGLGTWAVGYLGWPPATGLMPPVHRQQIEQVATPIVQHVLFGMATAAAYQAIQRLV
jgi:hypothetical protein